MSIHHEETKRGRHFGGPFWFQGLENGMKENRMIVSHAYERKMMRICVDSPQNVFKS